MFVRCVVVARVTDQRVQRDQRVGRLHTLSFTCQGHDDQASQIFLLQSAVKGRNSTRGLLFPEKKEKLEQFQKFKSLRKIRKYGQNQKYGARNIVIEK